MPTGAALHDFRVNLDHVCLPYMETNGLTVTMTALVSDDQ